RVLFRSEEKAACAATEGEPETVNRSVSEAGCNSFDIEGSADRGQTRETGPSLFRQDSGGVCEALHPEVQTPSQYLECFGNRVDFCRVIDIDDALHALRTDFQASRQLGRRYALADHFVEQQDLGAQRRRQLHGTLARLGLGWHGYLPPVLEIELHGGFKRVACHFKRICPARARGD